MFETNALLYLLIGLLTWCLSSCRQQLHLALGYYLYRCSDVTKWSIHVYQHLENSLEESDVNLQLVSCVGVILTMAWALWWCGVGALK